jgi:hypothetical protein
MARLLGNENLAGYYFALLDARDLKRAKLAASAYLGEVDRAAFHESGWKFREVRKDWGDARTQTAQPGG